MTYFAAIKNAARVLGALAIGLAACVPAAHAQYPEKPINVIVPFSAGGSADILARMVADHLSRSWKQPVVVQNKPGAGGQIATSYVARSPADGYTLIITSSGTVGVNPYIYKNLSYDPVKDFAHITVLADLPLILVANAESRFKTMAQLIAEAKAQPGGVSIGNSGIGSHQYLAARYFAKQAGISMNLIPYKGGGELVSALLSKTIDSAMDNVITQAPLMRSGRTRGLAVASAQRLAFLPDVPTFQEVGVKSNFGRAFYGIAAPAGTPAPVVDKLYAEIAAFLRQPDTAKRLTDMGVVGTASNPQETTDIVVDDIKVFGTIVKALDFKPE